VRKSPRFAVTQSVVVMNTQSSMQNPSIFNSNVLAAMLDGTYDVIRQWLLERFHPSISPTVIFPMDTHVAADEVASANTVTASHRVVPELVRGRVRRLLRNHYSKSLSNISPSNEDSSGGQVWLGRLPTYSMSEQRCGKLHPDKVL